jgi:hypothetical protein
VQWQWLFKLPQNPVDSIGKASPLQAAEKFCAEQNQLSRRLPPGLFIFHLELFIKFIIRCEISEVCHPEPLLAKDLPRMSQT